MQVGTGILFLSTLSLRRATFFSFWCILNLYISIHALLAESDTLRLLGWLRVLISIHALLAESDGVTVLGIQHRVGISIHALLAESDHAPSHSLYLRNNFYPRSPCGERLENALS